MPDVLDTFHPVIARWFAQHVGTPTPPQVHGWPHIAAGESTLILAPTGSGKTLAAFLAAIDRLARDLLDDRLAPDAGVQILYLSPLKALANDVQKNLLTPLEQMHAVARAMGVPWPDIRVALRTGDTPQKDRAAILRDPPHLLITTPESLHLMLTSAARKILRTTRYVIIDEVHAIAPTKRGTFLSLLLERLDHERHAGRTRKTKVAPGVYLAPDDVPPLVRIALSATVRPPERIAAWLSPDRPMQVVNTGQRKRLDLAVQCPWGLADPALAGDKSNWPAVVRLLLQLIREHRSTLVFANSRRLVERLLGMMEQHALGTELPPMQPHHGSIAKEVRLATEQLLKAGDLAAVFATSSLELGIDIGALDLVCQVESPGNIAAALQRVGRAGHLEKATAKGRMIPKSVPDLAQFAALIPLMLEGRVEETVIPTNCLDVLAQQIVACCAVEPWDATALFTLLTRSGNYRDLPRAQFDAVVEMLSTRPTDLAGVGFSAPVRPRISFDRVNNRLIALPASARLAITNGGVISDTGQYPVYIAGSTARIGELDEEFVYESRVGDRIILGSQTWQIDHIDIDRVLVTPAGASAGRMPFWRGESAPRTILMGEAYGTLLRELAERHAQDEDACRRWLIDQHRLDDAGADELIGLHTRQTLHGSALPTDQRVIVEHFRDRTGDPMTAILTPLGTKVHHALRLALEARLADRRIPAQVIHNDDGVLIRPAGEVTLPDNPLSLLTADLLEPLIVDQLEQSALFGLRFRQNAARALMLPRSNPKRRTPLWQQRLRARNLLAIVKQHRNFPIVVETYRECLQDALAVARTRQLLADIETGRVAVGVHEVITPSPFVRSLWFDFEAAFLYQWDEPQAVSQHGPTVDAAVLDQVLMKKGEEALHDPTRAAAWTDEDLATLSRRIAGSDFPARTPEELLEKIAAAGPVAAGPPTDPVWADWVVDHPAPMLRTLLTDHRLVVLPWPGTPDHRYVATETLGMILSALGTTAHVYTYDNDTLIPLPTDTLPPALLAPPLPTEGARQRLIEIAFRTTALLTVADLAARFPFMAGDVPEIIGRLLAAGMIAAVPERPGAYALPDHLDQLRNIALRRQRRSVATADLPALQRHLLAWHRIAEPLPGRDGIEDALDALTPLAFPLETWQGDILPARAAAFTPHLLDQLLTDGHWVPVGYGTAGIAFLPRHLLTQRPPHEPATPTPAAQRILDYLTTRGASYALDLELDLLLTPDELLPLLRELIDAGRISNDRLPSLAAALHASTPKPAPAADAIDPARYPDSFHTAPAARRPRDRRADRLARLKVGRGSGVSRHALEHHNLGGRWYVLPAPIAPADALAAADAAVDRVERLLRRHAFACRELTDPAADGTWRDAYDVLTRMEWAGHVRRGYFVDRLSGAQFALPTLHLDTPTRSAAPITYLAMLDPANLYARTQTRFTTPDGTPLRIPRTPGTYLALHQGTPVLAAVAWGGTLMPLSTQQEHLDAALRALPALLTRIPADARQLLHVKRWGDADILGTPAEEVLRSVGFTRDTAGLKLYRQYA